MENIEKTTANLSSRCCFSSDNEDFVGFQEDVKQIIHKLIGGPKERNVISIVGMAGLGKTTLARKVYNNHSIADHFDVRVFCTISQTYSVRKLLCEILKQATGEKLKEDEDDVADALRRALYCKRYLIVLDDMWNNEAWEDLQLCFPCVESGSGIMVTTRFREVAIQISDPYFLRFLTDEESWELLQKKVFKGENNSCPLELRSVGQLVAKQCKGLPSLIITIAGILSSKKREASLWLEVARDISSHAYEEEMSMKAIRSSYDHLLDHLKPCLLYMGLFPKNYEIPVSDLLKWWIAEEFVQDTGTLMLEELSENCLYDLVDRNLVVVSKTRWNGRMKCCIVVDQVREFCLRQIREEKFMQLIVPYNYSHQPVEQRLCMYIHDTMTSDNFNESQEFIVHPKFTKLDRKNPFRLLNNLILVRVLHLLDIYLDNSLASTFQSLPHLRYLAIFVKAFDVKWVSHLLHLQTLRVRSSYIMISPAIWKMSKLRHVDINEFPFAVSCQADDDIVLHNLKTLGMCYMSVADMTHNFWDKFPNVEQLKVHINEFGDHVPNVLMNLDVIFPSRLRSLSLTEIFLTDEIVSSIANLLNLETLKLSEIYFTGENKHWDLTDTMFVKLKFLKLHRVFMNKWSCSEESFPCLEYLVVKSCSKLGQIPSTFGDISALRSIKVIDCSDSVGNSAVKINEYFEDMCGCSIQLQVLKKDK